MYTLLEFLAQHPLLTAFALLVTVFAILAVCFISWIFQDHRIHFRGPELEINPPTVQAKE